MSTAITEYRPQTLQIQETWFDASLVVHQVKQVQKIMKAVMKNETHYGKIPGTDKPTLYKAGAEILSLTFRLDPQFDVTVVDLEEGHREYKVVCNMFNLVTGQRLGSGVGSCSTKESKYRYRYAKLKCPECGRETLNKSKQGQGWYCWAKIGGCGSTFKANDERILHQPRGKVENPDIADVYNTVLKMGKKRAFVDAILTVTAASDMFTQDLEDLEEHYPEPTLPVVSQRLLSRFKEVTVQKVKEGILPPEKIQEATAMCTTGVYHGKQGDEPLTDALLQQFITKLERLQPKPETSPEPEPSNTFTPDPACQLDPDCQRYAWEVEQHGSVIMQAAMQDAVTAGDEDKIAEIYASHQTRLRQA